MSPDDIVCPIATRHTHTVHCFAPWFVQGTEYGPVASFYAPLVNGQEAFEAVHKAIAEAKSTVDIICWGFQPSMYFIRDGRSPSIGELLRQKASDRVKVRILGWEYPLNLAGAAGEGNLPGKGALHLWDQALQSSTKRQYNYDKQWFSDCEVADDQAAGRVDGKLPIFVSRGFSWAERQTILDDLKLHGRDPAISWSTRFMQAAAPSHHQKSVLVDYEIPDRAIGFVMGHNMLDEYWDTDRHSALNREPFKPDPDRGARGHRPRQDISCQVNGPVLEYLHHNFAMAWRKETGEDLMTTRQAKSVATQLRPRGQPLMLQMLRTQPQHGKRDIESAYLNAINNATRFIYIENQYFRWPPLAEAIKKTAQQLSQAGRDPGKHGSLHLFVVTNDTVDGVGAGTLNTQRMLESLGRADTIPNVTKLRRIEQIKKDLPPQPRPEPRDAEGQRRLRAWEAERDRQIRAVEESKILPDRDIPGLKVHVCSLVAPDTPDGADWMPVYVHSKLMIVDDVYTIQGSANINTRSMQVDSELNVAHEWASVTKALRRRLWGLHTGGEGDQDDADIAFYNWQKMLDENAYNKSKHQSPSVPLVEFYYKEAVLKDLD